MDLDDVAPACEHEWGPAEIVIRGLRGADLVMYCGRCGSEAYEAGKGDDPKRPKLF